MSLGYYIKDGIRDLFRSHGVERYLETSIGWAYGMAKLVNT
jgi:hypothetical protein